MSPMSVSVSCEGGVGRLVLRHPPLNILTRAVLAGVRKELDALGEDPTLRVLILSAEGKHFSAGADVGEHLPPYHAELIPEFIATIEMLDAFPVPIVAAVQGQCVGGGFELVQAADLIVAAEDARFGQPEIQLGVIAPAACVLLPEIAPAGAAAELLFTGDPISAEDALEIGLVRRVVPRAELDGEASALAERIARNSPAALRLVKRAMKGERRVARARWLRDVGVVYEEELMRTEDALEGLRAFVEKREPQWVGR